MRPDPVYCLRRSADILSRAGVTSWLELAVLLEKLFASSSDHAFRAPLPRPRKTTVPVILAEADTRVPRSVRETPAPLGDDTALREPRQRRLLRGA